MNYSRRNFFRITSAIAGLETVGYLADEAVSAQAKPMFVDTHLHCFAGTGDARFPYHPRGPYQPAAAATPEHLLKCMDGADVSVAVVVHPEPYQDDHRYLKHCLQVGGKRLKGTCLFFADRSGFETELRALVKEFPGRIVAARVHAYNPDRLPPFGKPELKALWRTASDLGLALQLHFEPRYAAGFEPLIAEFPSTKVIIDHLGRPFQGSPEEHAKVVGWSRFPNTIMKIASLPEKTQYPHREIGPVIKQLTDAFGPERMISGGGFSETATPESYRGYRQRLIELLAHLSTAERAKILGENAIRLFAFD